MLTFSKIISSLSAEAGVFIAEHIEQARQYIQSDDYDREYDDITPHIFEEIGEALFLAVYEYPEEPEPEPPPQPVLEPSEEAFYCRKCEAPQAFVKQTRTRAEVIEALGDGAAFYNDEELVAIASIGPLICKVCGTARAEAQGSIPRR